MITRRNFVGSVIGCVAVAAAPLTAFDAAPEYVNVLDFGAIGDGINDDTAAVQAAIDAAESGVFFPAGTYRCNATLRPETRIKGSPDGASRIRAAVTYDPVVRMSNGAAYGLIQL